MRDTRNATPMIGLICAAAVLAWALLPAVERYGRVYADAEDAERAIAPFDESINAFWRSRFPRDYPEARRGYTRPRVDIHRAETPLSDDIAGIYSQDTARIRLNPAAPGGRSPFTLAHEYGHHIQMLTGELDALAALDPRDASIRRELQAECLAGVWARHAEETGVLSRRAVQREVLLRLRSPDSETHGSAEQRANWLQRGYDASSAVACRTLETPAAEL